ncbi:MAG: hypothetical protein Q8O07_05300 [Chloroflexota bacterium]|nr:hypothetical protein [Chloroflexota bacterium]
MPNVYAMALAKGGSGKTTTTVNLGHGLALALGLWFGEAYGNPPRQAMCSQGYKSE